MHRFCYKGVNVLKLTNMIEYFKKNAIFCCTFFLSIAMFCTLGFAVYGKISEKCTSAETSKVIIIDPGHGGEDGGAVGVDGIIEKDINLAISLKVRDYLEASGYKVIMTRDTDTAIYDEDAESLRNKKRSDLHNRAKIINDNAAEGNIFVSIHQNKFPDSKYFGTQIFYSKNDPKSQNLASGIKDSVVGLIQPENTREIKAADKKIFLLDKSKIPAVVVECGFLSNKEEALKLTDKNYQNKMAFCIYCGIINYYLNNT